MSLFNRLSRAYHEFTSLDEAVKAVAPQPFGPGAPPKALNPLPPYSFDYRTGYNTETAPKQGEGISFKQLRNMARYC